MLSGISIAILVFVTAATGAIFKPGEWYLSLNKPSWTPPNWAFPVVWTILYCMIAFAGWLVWEEGAILSIVVWGAQLIINGLWSYIFFGLKRMYLGLIDISLLIFIVVLFIVVTYPISKIAALLFLPYLVWICIAVLLNWRIIQLNSNAKK